MGIFGSKKKDDFLDLTEHYKMQRKASIMKMKEQEKLAESGSKVNFYPNFDSSPKEDVETSKPSETNSGGFMSNFFGGDKSTPSPASAEDTESSYVGTSQTDVAEKRKRLAKRLIDMTDKIEDLSNQIYHLNERIEVLERKTGAGNY